MESCGLLMQASCSDACSWVSGRYGDWRTKRKLLVLRAQAIYSLCSVLVLKLMRAPVDTGCQLPTPGPSTRLGGTRLWAARLRQRLARLGGSVHTHKHNVLAATAYKPMREVRVRSQLPGRSSRSHICCLCCSV